MHPILDILRALDAASVRCVVVGGVAVTLQGPIRATVELDLVIDLVGENVDATLDVLRGLGLVPRLPVDPAALADAGVRREWVETRLLAFAFHDPVDSRREVDLLIAPSVPVAALLAEADQRMIGELSVPVASPAHLIALKRAAGRHQDLADIATLQEMAMDEDARAEALAPLTPMQRIEWLEQTLDLLRTTEALAADRERRRAEAQWFSDGRDVSAVG